MAERPIGFSYVSRNVAKILEWLQNGDEVLLTYEGQVVAEIISRTTKSIRNETVSYESSRPMIKSADTDRYGKIPTVALKASNVTKLSYENWREMSKETFGSDFDEEKCRASYKARWESNGS